MWLNKWVHKLLLQCRSRSFFNLKPVSVIVYQFQTVRFIEMMSLTFGLFTQVSGSGPLGPLVFIYNNNNSKYHFTTSKITKELKQRSRLGTRAQIFQILWWILFIFGMMIDIRLKFYFIPSVPLGMDHLEVKVRDLLLKFYVKLFWELIFSEPYDGCRSIWHDERHWP